MNDFLELMLRQKVLVSTYTANNKWPLLYKKNYDYYLVQVNDVEFLIVKPKQILNLLSLRKQFRQIEVLANQNCALYLTSINYYAKDKLLDEGIPFVLENKEIYLPFFAVYLQNKSGRNLKSISQISFLTQKMLILAIYENWNHVNVTEASQRLNVTKMSITRCFDEIEVLGLPFLNKKANSRYFSTLKPKKEMWNLILPYLRNPIIKQFNLIDRIQDISILSGMSALASYSLLEDNEYPTYAITKKDLDQLQLNKRKQVPYNEVPGSIVHEMGYYIPFENKNAIDPLSLTLTLTQEEKADDRVQIAIDEMLEEYVWCEE